MMSDAVSVSYAVGRADLVSPLIDRVCTLYDEVFSAPPFFWRDDESQLHRDRLGRLLRDESFGAATASAGVELVGFAYGFTVPATTTRWAGLREPVAPAVATEWPGRTFLLFDFAVHPSWRGRGVGRHLHDLLLGSRAEERATLTVQPTAEDTKRLYRRWGWRQVGQIDGDATAAAPVFDVFLRDSLVDLRAGQPMP